MRVLGASDSIPGEIYIWTGYMVRGRPNPFKEESCKMVATKNDQWEQGQGEKRLTSRTTGSQTLYS